MIYTSTIFNRQLPAPRPSHLPRLRLRYLFDLKYPLRTFVGFQVVGDVVADGLERGGLDEEDDGFAKRILELIEGGNACG